MSTQAGGLFMDYRLGETEELSQRLRDLSSVKVADKKEKRDIIQKVVGYMTLGLDMSTIFMDILKEATTRDVIQKKLVYLYLVHYSTVDPQKTMMAISCLQKDCFDDDPVIRGLALRSLCSVRVQDLTEYVVDPLKKGLCDTTPYVRKTAVMGCLKLYITSPETANTFRVNEQLMTMIRDRDAQVVSNSLYVLNEIWITQGGLTLEHKNIVYLLNRMRDFNDWGQCMILEIASRHSAGSDKEVFDILNLLDPRLQTTNCGVILAIAKVFLHLTDRESIKPAIKAQVAKRLQLPIITHMCSQGPELAYVLLQHIQLLVDRDASVFVPEYKRFYIRVNDPAYTKMIKMNIMTALVTPENVDDIATEIVFSTKDMDIVVSKHAVRKVGEVSAKLDGEDRAPIFSQLLGMLEGHASHIINTAIVAVSEMLRKYPEVAKLDDVLPELEKLICKNHESLEDPEGKDHSARCAALWILGEYGPGWADAPYVLEDICEEYDKEKSSTVRLQMLNTCARMFFQRPAECKKLLATMLKASIEEEDEDEDDEDEANKEGNSQDVRDRALLYYRLFQGKIQQAWAVICPAREPIVQFAEEDSVELKEAIFKEFNSLSVVYNQSAESFLLPYPKPGMILQTPEEKRIEEEEEAERVAAEQTAARLAAEAEERGVVGYVAPAVAQAISLVLPPQPITQQVFAATWQKEAGMQSNPFQLGQDLNGTVNKLKSLGVEVFAKGNTPDGGAKIYVFAQFMDGTRGFAELMATPTGQMSAVVKCQHNDAAKTKFILQLLSTLRG